MFSTNYDTSSDKFQNYYKDLSLRMKNRQVDLLIQVILLTLLYKQAGEKEDRDREVEGIL